MQGSWGKAGGDPWGAAGNDIWGSKGRGPYGDPWGVAGPKGDPWGVAGPKGSNRAGQMGMDSWAAALASWGMGGAAWGLGGVVAPAAEWKEPPAGPPPNIHWLEFGPESPLVQAGYQSRAPAILYDKTSTVFQSSHHILQHCVSDISTVVQVDHDEDWEKYPGVGEKFKQQTGEENCYAVASSVEHAKFGVGFHAGKQGRERSAKLALAVAIAEGTPLEAELRRQYPDFAEVLDNKSVSSTKQVTPAVATSPALLGQAVAAQQLAMSSGVQPLMGGHEMELLSSLGGMAAASTATSESLQMPTGVQVCTLTIPVTSRLVLQGLSMQPPAVLYDKTYARLFGSATNILKTLLQHLGAPLAVTVQVTHDPDWLEYPEIGAAMKPAGIEDDCYALAVCPSLVKWAIGIASGWDKREKAAYLALAIAVAADSPHKTVVMTEYPEFSMMCVNAGLV